MLRGVIFAAVLGLTAAPAVARENYALLIGASAYPNLDQKYWLKGPANDVRLVQTYLTTAAPVPFAPQDVIVLADGVAGGVAPTLAAIRGAFADLTAKVQPGDFVYLHFSGHGSQTPALQPETELDGLDETFMPVDIGPWQDDVGVVQNALVDDEIGALIDGLRGKGADVWAVFDSCHSGTVTRGIAEEDVRLRQLPAEALGIPAEAMEPATRAIADPRAVPEAPFDGGTAAGSFVAFFAAQTNEVTPEKNLPKGKPGRVPQGVFTYALFEVLAEYPGASYGQIGQEVLRRYASKKLAQTTPLFEGDLDRVAFSGTPGARVAQWTAAARDGGYGIAAGSLHGLAEGAVLAVMAKATDPDAAALGYVTLTTVDTFSAQAVAVADKAPPADLPKGALLRKIGSDVDFTLTVALPEAGASSALEAAMGALQAASGPRLVYVAAAAEADLRLAVLPDSARPDAIWVLPATGLIDDLAGTPSVATADKGAQALGETLADTLTTMARAINLQKLGAAVGTGGLEVEVELLTGPDKDSLTAVKAATVPRLVPDDQVHILARNNMETPVDVNVLYIAADYAISHWFSGRLQPGDTLKKGLFKIGDEVLGAERMIVVMTPALPQSPVEDLSFLAQDALETSRGVRGPGIVSALEEAGFGQTTRSAQALEEDGATGPAPGIIQLELRTVAAP